ncbi:MAG: hypothetical protein JXB30_11760 [Anaerolineae bacterium]|nr:hypothetical protein [Anaerolineae bacterium]
MSLDANIRYVVESGAGVWSLGPKGVLTTTSVWLAGDRTELEQHRAAAVRAGKPKTALIRRRLMPNCTSL